MFRGVFSRALVLWVATVLALLTGVAAPATAQPYQDRMASLDPANFTPDLIADQVVAHPRTLAMAVTDTTVYVGGQFNTVSNNKRTQFATRTNLFAFNRTTGALLPWAPTVDGLVWSIAVVGRSVYIGGDFKTVNGFARPRIAKLSLTTGALDQSFQPPITVGRVTDIKPVGTVLFVSGSFGPKLLSLNPASGANTKYFAGISVAGSWANATGNGEIYRFAVDPAATRLVAVGDFKTVNGRAASRVFMLDLTPTGATLDPWHYEPFEQWCSSTDWPAYVQDVDFSPDGSYFAVVAGGYLPPDGTHGYVCDAAARFETNVTYPSQPTWINYTGGDTLRSVALTGTAVYVQGHNRWLDNPYGHNDAGPGAVDALGGGAIDPSTGHAFIWNPDHPCSDGGRVIESTPDGVWWGGDWTFYNREPRRGVAFTPLV